MAQVKPAKQRTIRSYDLDADDIYVFDTSIISQLFRNYYSETFPGLWKKVNEYVLDGKIISVSEAKNELLQHNNLPKMTNWIHKNSGIFLEPIPEEFNFIAELFKKPAGRQLINRKNILEGLPAADPFIIAKAYSIKGTVVTTEKFKENAPKIPNICQEYSVPCFSLQNFFKKEKWIFS
ncbi:DUF4411 family protein [Methanolapillus ohkumae]|uniref:DUF4411 family protein n=1 Tax=Methanolapillus ohkumae TaxID=3028298 RepID=A0AA96V530_9EURY|nr:hypothetical protein MsAm2_05450 [Methanosarcinaceae archaeon Am2]